MEDKEIEPSEKQTFTVKVQFYQNSTWQGTIYWNDKKKTCHFRSTLEMLRLMDEAIEETAASVEE